MQFSKDDIKLFYEAGVNVENKNYSKDKVEKIKK